MDGPANPSPLADVRLLEHGPSDAGPRPFDVVTGPIRLVLVDAEPAFTRVVVARSDVLGWQHRVIGTAPRIEELVAIRPGAIVLDPATCEGDPWAYLGRLAAALPDAGLIVTANDAPVADRVRGLRLGADDWIAKPAHPDEVIARVQAVVRRRRAFADDADPGPIVAGELQIRPDRFQAYVGGETVGLTRREYELLALLARAEGRVLEREEIYRRVWGYAMVHGDRSVDVFVRKVRGKLKASSPGWRYVHTHFGVGYRFGPEPAPEG